MDCPACYGDGSVPAHVSSGIQKCRVCRGTGEAPWSDLLEAAEEVTKIIPDLAFPRLRNAIDKARGETK